MALDDKVFQSAIAKINRRKSRQSPIVPIVHVFEDPPHVQNKTRGDIEVNYNDPRNLDRRKKEI
jgi:hypothetical protein